MWKGLRNSRIVRKRTKSNISWCRTSDIVCRKCFSNTNIKRAKRRFELFSKQCFCFHIPVRKHVLLYLWRLPLLSGSLVNRPNVRHCLGLWIQIFTHHCQAFQPLVVVYVTDCNGVVTNGKCLEIREYLNRTLHNIGITKGSMTMSFIAILEITPTKISTHHLS